MSQKTYEILNDGQKKLLNQLLNSSKNKENVFNLHNLEGFLYGVAITPEPIMPHELIWVIFGQREPNLNLKTLDEANILLENLMVCYNAYIQAYWDKTLQFPYDFNNLKVDILDEIWKWANGFSIAISLRPEIWRIDKKSLNKKKVGEQTKKLQTSFEYLQYIVNPQLLQEKLPNSNDNDILEITTLCWAGLPVIVHIFQEYSYKCTKEQYKYIAKEKDKKDKTKAKTAKGETKPTDIN
jgi:yecA family protein